MKGLEEKSEPKTLPRWVTILLGIILVPFALMSVIGSLVVLLAPNVPYSVLTIFLGTVFLAGSLWVLLLSLRLIFISPNNRKGFISPTALKVGAAIFASIPIVSLLIGKFWERPVAYGIMTVAYIGMIYRALAMARQREKRSRQISQEANGSPKGEAW